MTKDRKSILHNRDEAKAIFRAVAGGWPSGVAVITATDAAGTKLGLTMSAVMSLSLSPMQLLISVDKGSQTLPAILESQRFCINILAEGQEEIALRFAAKEADKFEGVAHSSLETGGLLLTGAMAYADCQLAASHEGGDHLILVGAVLDMALCGGAPLVYWAGGFRRFAA